MAKTHSVSTCVDPIDPLALFSKAVEALGVACSPEDKTPEKIVARPFPDEDLEASRFKDLYLLKEILRKYPGFDLGIDTKAAAVQSLLDTERVNAETNRSFDQYDVENPRVEWIIESARRKIHAVLGQFDWADFVKGLRFGPGATTRIRSQNATPYNKLEGPPHVSIDALDLGRTVLSLSPQWAYGDAYKIKSVCLPVTIQDFDRFATVRKNAMTDRTIGIPPDLNNLMQLAVGYCMRKKMFGWGIDLQDQSINQQRAHFGSLTGFDATVDVKNASNSVTEGLVFRLLDTSGLRNADSTWLDLMDKIRTRGTVMEDGRIHYYELFSAMGNGFTFELESLIFWALSRAVCEVLELPQNVSVYGDDIILPSEAVPTLMAVFTRCGFTINESKTFYGVGPGFRESCGKHYLRGIDVSPFYVDTKLDTVESVLVLANNITRWALDPESGVRDGRMRHLWEWVVSHLPQVVQDSAIPYGDADDGLIRPFDEAVPASVYAHQLPVVPQRKPGHVNSRTRGLPKAKVPTWVGYRARTATTVARKAEGHGYYGYVTWLYNKSFTRFQPPRETPEWLEKWKLPPHLSTEWVEAREGFPLTKIVGKRSVVIGTRVTDVWPFIGPWE